MSAPTTGFNAADFILAALNDGEPWAVDAWAHRREELELVASSVPTVRYCCRGTPANEAFHKECHVQHKTLAAAERCLARLDRYWNLGTRPFAPGKGYIERVDRVSFRIKPRRGSLKQSSGALGRRS